MNLPFGTQMAVAGIISLVIGWLKKSKWCPWITTETAKVNRVVMILLSGLGTLGIHFTYSHTAGTLLITGLTWATFGAGLWHWVVQSFVTHGWYKWMWYAEQILAYVRPPTMTVQSPAEKTFYQNLAVTPTPP